MLVTRGMSPCLGTRGPSDRQMMALDWARGATRERKSWRDWVLERPSPTAPAALRYACN